MGKQYDLITCYKVWYTLRIDLDEIGAEPEEECYDHDDPDDREWCVREGIYEALDAYYGGNRPFGEETERNFQHSYLESVRGDE
jgi:hypothetical protein